MDIDGRLTPSPSVLRSHKTVKKLLSRVTKSKWEEDADIEKNLHPHETSKATRYLGVLFLAYQAIGVVYGDIGTSPLYVFASVFTDSTGVVPTPENVIGAASLIIWTITAIVVVKYGLIVLRADDNGQGGAFALYSLLKRAADFRTFGKAHPSDKTLTHYSVPSVRMSRSSSMRISMQRASSGLRVSPTGGTASNSETAAASGLGKPSTIPEERPSTNSKLRGAGAPVWSTKPNWRIAMCRSKAFQRSIRVAVVIGVGMIMGDGVLTPAISVVSAAEGLKLVSNSITTGVVVGISMGIIAGLFLIQQFGTSLIGKCFSPIVLIWFAFNFVVGWINIFKYDPSVFRALGPNYWFAYFLRNGNNAWKSLGGVLLCITGAEALFADLGHFSRQSIQLSLLFLVWPTLVITYLGQAAFLIKNPDEVSQTFWKSIPHSFFWPMFVSATLAAIVASQALISAVFNIVFQAISQGFFPRFHTKHTSTTIYGQVYIPFINYLLMALTLIVVGTFKTSEKLGRAYGLSVVCDMLLTTHFMTLVQIIVWDLPIVLPICFYLAFGTIEALFLSSSIEKVPQGGWFSILVASIYASIMLLWFWGSKQKKAWFKLDDKLENVLCPEHEDTAGELVPLIMKSSGTKIARVPGIALYYEQEIYGVPAVLKQHLNKFPVVHTINIFITNRNVPIPKINPDERLLVNKLEITGFYHIIARYGYMEDVEHNEAFVVMAIEHLRVLISQALLETAKTCELVKVALDTIPTNTGPEASIAASEPVVVSEMAAKGVDLSAIGLTGGDAVSSVPSPLTPLQFTLPTGTAAGSSSNKEKSFKAKDMRRVQSIRSMKEDGTTQELAALPAQQRDQLEKLAERLLSGVNLPGEEDENVIQQTQLAVARGLARELRALPNVDEVDYKDVAFVLGRPHLRATRRSNPLRRVFLEAPYKVLVNNLQMDAHLQFNIPESQLVEVGMIYEV